MANILTILKTNSYKVNFSKLNYKKYNNLETKFLIFLSLYLFLSRNSFFFWVIDLLKQVRLRGLNNIISDLVYYMTKV